MSTGNPGPREDREKALGLLDLPDELLVQILEGCCTVDALLSMNETNRRLHRIAAEILGNCIRALDLQGLRFLPHQTGLDVTVGELLKTLETTTLSWIDAKIKRKVKRLREASGATDTYIFDDIMMCCNQKTRIRRLELFGLEATKQDPVSSQLGRPLEIGHDYSLARSTFGPISVECYDSGQDLLCLVHKQENISGPLHMSLYSLRSLVPHPLAVEPILKVPAHFIDGHLEAVFICGRSIGLLIQNSGDGDCIVVFRWKGKSIFPAVFRLMPLNEQILHMIFMDEDHPLVLTAPRVSIEEQDHADEYTFTPVKLRLLELQEVHGNISDALTLYATSLLCEGPQFLFPPLKPRATLDQDMSWILPYHPSSPCTSLSVAPHLRPSPLYDPSSHSGVFIIHLGGSSGQGEEEEWQVQVAILKSELMPWRGEEKQEVEWDTWGREATRIFQPRPDIDPSNAVDPLKSCFMTWVENYRTAAIAFDYHKEIQLFHVLDFNPYTLRRVKESETCAGTLITEPWNLQYDSSPFLVNVETCLPFYVVDFDLGDIGLGAGNGEPCMIRLSSTGLLFERDELDTEETQVGFCWIDDGVEAYLDEQAGLEHGPPSPNGSDSSSSSSHSRSV